MTRRYEKFSKYTGKSSKEVLVETTPDTNNQSTQSNKETTMNTNKPEINAENIQGLIEACMVRVLGRAAESEEDFVKLAQDPEYQELSKTAMEMAMFAAAEEVAKQMDESGVVKHTQELGVLETSLKSEVARILGKPQNEVKTSDFVDAARLESSVIFGMKMLVTKLSQVKDAFEKLDPEASKGKEEITNQLTIMSESIRIIEEQLAAEKAAKAKAEAEAVSKAAEATKSTQSTNSNKEPEMENKTTKEQAYEKAKEEFIKEKAQDIGAEMRKAAKEAEKGFFERHKSTLLMGAGALAAVGIGYGIYSFFSGEEAVNAVASVATDAAEAVTESAVETSVTAAFANLLK